MVISTKQPRLTAISNLGIWLNLKLVLYLESFGKSENKSQFSAKPAGVSKRYWIVMP